MNNPAIPRRHFWNPKQVTVKPPISRQKEMQHKVLSASQGDSGVSNMIKQKGKR